MPKEKKDFRGESPLFAGKELKEAYASIFQGILNGGFDDQGRDLFTQEKEVPEIQIKSSVHEAKKFLIESLRRKEFIPICIGEPGSREEMIETIKKFGAWIGREIPNRNELLTKISQVRDYCTS